jgi:predicted XRE-type DNA-binding protein
MKTMLQRFNEKWELDLATGCWVWTAGTSAFGYGRFNVGDNEIKQAHRVSYKIHYGSIPNQDGYHGNCVCHSCDNPPCVNPAHLFIGTQKQNMEDVAGKNRMPRRLGRDNDNAKLTENMVLEIRDWSEAGIKQREIAAAYGTNQPHVSSIILRKIWTHL